MCRCNADVGWATGHRYLVYLPLVFFFQAEDGIRDVAVTGVQTCALPICLDRHLKTQGDKTAIIFEADDGKRSEEHTSELQSRLHLVCRLLLEKKKKKKQK